MITSIKDTSFKDPTIKVGDTRGGQLEGLSGPSGDQASSGLIGSWGKAKTELQVLLHEWGEGGRIGHARGLREN